MTRVPQELASFKVPTKAPIDSLPRLRKLITTTERELGDEGRVLVRYSGTEKKMRVMVECLDSSRLGGYVEDLKACALQELGAAGDAG